MISWLLQVTGIRQKRACRAVIFVESPASPKRPRREPPPGVSFAFASAIEALEMAVDWKLSDGSYRLESRSANVSLWVANEEYGLSMGEYSPRDSVQAHPIKFRYEERKRLWPMVEAKIVELIDSKRTCAARSMVVESKVV